MLRRSFVNLLFSACLRAYSELIDECNKQDFDKVMQSTTSIASSFACRPPARAYMSPGREASLRKCRASRMSWSGGSQCLLDQGCIIIRGVLPPTSPPHHALVCVAHPLRIFPCESAMRTTAREKRANRKGSVRAVLHMGHMSGGTTKRRAS